MKPVIAGAATHEIKIFEHDPHLTESKPSAAILKPTMAAMIAWVVETGKLSQNNSQQHWHQYQNS